MQIKVKFVSVARYIDDGELEAIWQKANPLAHLADTHKVMRYARPQNRFLTKRLVVNK